jgi:four helix bundle protein
MAMRFEDIEVWKKAARLSATLYVEFRDLRDFGFRDQITRSGLSIVSNIAEGYERDSEREFARFLRIAKGSCGELRAQIYIGMEAGYIDKNQGKKWLESCFEISRMLYGFIGRLGDHANAHKP